jgi:hypothetical protein
VDYKLCCWCVQVNGGGARDEVKKGGGPRVEGSGLYRFHGNKSDVVEGVSLNALNKC